jgi:hypothetical protein
MLTRTLASLLCTVVVAATAAGCSGDSGKDKDKDASPSKSASPTDSESVNPDNVSPPLKAVPTVKGEKGDIDALTMGECDTASGAQSIAGKIKSSANKKVDYLVTVSWTTAGGDVMGRGFKVLENVAPGETKSFKIKAKVADGATQCVKGVAYGQVG